MKAYIISYFGKGKNTQAMRQGYHSIQLNSLIKNPDIDEIVVLAQLYNDKIDKGIMVSRPRDYLCAVDPKVRYIHTTKLLKPGPARNVLIDEFNKTSDEWALFLDNDAIFDPRWHGGEVVGIIERNAKSLADKMSVISVLSPRHWAYTGFLEDNAKILVDYLILQKYNYIKTTMFFLRNDTLRGEQPIYFDDQLESLEDYDYVPRLLAAGRAIYMTMSAVISDLAVDEAASTLFEDGVRTQQFDEIKDIIFDRYEKYGAIRVGGKIRWERMCDNRNLTKMYYVPKDGTGVTNSANPNYHNLFEETLY